MAPAQSVILLDGELDLDDNKKYLVVVKSKELYVTRYWYVNWAMVVHINIQGPLN